MLVLPKSQRESDCHLRRSNSDNSNVVKFCKFVNPIYEDTFQTLNLQPLAPYVTRSLYAYIYNSLSFSRSWVGIPDNYRTVYWDLVQEEGTKSIVRKTVMFDKIKTSTNVKISLANNFSELWLVNISEGKYIVERIKEINDNTV